MTPFTYDQPSGRIVFGAGSLDPLPEEVERLGRALRSRSFDAGTDSQA
jgi:hypothetical protein